MVVERRYTVRERSSVTQSEVLDCARRVGAEVLGLQAELDKSDCSNEVRPVLQSSVTRPDPGRTSGQTCSTPAGWRG